jgi:flagellar FliJ protein
MKRFRFNLRPVSVIRAHRELRAREAFATAVHLYVEAEEKLARIRQRKSEFEAALLAGRSARFDAAGEAQTLIAYRHECTEETAGEQAVATAHQVMTERRTQYLEAHRHLEVVQRLEAKARLAHRQETLRAEQAEFDDFAGRAAHRKLSHA